MRFVLYLIMSLIFFNGVAIAGDGFDITGQEWNGWKDNSKMYFIMGWIKCGLSANNNMTINMNKYNESVEFLKMQDRIFRREGVIIGNASVGQVLDTTNIIYSDSRTKYIDIEYIMPLVMGRLVGGWTLEQLDKIISYLIRIDKCQKEEKQFGKFTDECSTLRKERNAYMSTLNR